MWDGTGDVLGVLSAVMRPLLRSVVEKNERSGKGKLLIYWFIYNPTLRVRRCGS